MSKRQKRHGVRTTSLSVRGSERDQDDRGCPSQIAPIEGTKPDRPKRVLGVLASHPGFTIIAGLASIVGLILAFYPLMSRPPIPTLLVHKVSVYDDLSGDYPHVGLEFTVANPRTTPVTLGPCSITTFYRPSDRWVESHLYYLTDLSSPPNR